LGEGKRGKGAYSAPWCPLGAPASAFGSLSQTWCTWSRPAGPRAALRQPHPMPALLRACQRRRMVGVHMVGMAQKFNKRHDDQPWIPTADMAALFRRPAPIRAWYRGCARGAEKAGGQSMLLASRAVGSSSRAHAPTRTHHRLARLLDLPYRALASPRSDPRRI